MSIFSIRMFPIFLLAGVAFVPAIAAAENPVAAPKNGQASAAAETVLGDIIVTATRRSESVQNVGIAINAFSGEQLQELGLTNSTQLAQLTPGVTATGAQAGFLQTFAIRGVTQNDYLPHQEGPVATYIDDVYISSLQGQSFSTFDTERVEILKGPQGTLFGRNATGGLVHYVSRKPTFETNGYVDAKYGTYNLRQFEGAFGAPIVADKVAFRIAGLYRAHDPILENTIGANPDDEETFAVRAHLLIEPSSEFKILLSGRYGKLTTVEGSAEQFVPAVPVFNAAGNQIDDLVLGPTDTSARLVQQPDGTLLGVGARPCPGCNYFGYRDPDGSGPHVADGLVGTQISTVGPNQLRNFSTAYGATANLEGTVGNITITSITDYSHFAWRNGFGLLDGPNAPLLGFQTYAKGIRQFSEEFRVAGNYGTLRWTAGAYYLNIKSDNGDNTGFVNHFSGPTSPTNPDIDEVHTFSQKTSSPSVFGQAEYDLTSQLTLIAGARYIRERKEFDFAETIEPFGIFLVPPFNTSTTPLALQSGGLWSWKAGLNYKPADTLLFYATVNRGVKAGGFNAPYTAGDPTNPNNPIPYTFKPERLTAYEGGFKSSILDRKATLNGTVFYYDYKDYQAYRNIGFTNFLFNADARTIGAELDLSANPVEGLNVQFGASYTDALVKDVQIAPGFIDDRRPAFAPKVQLTGLARYEIPVGPLKLGLQLDGSYRTPYFLQITNFQALKQSGYALLNGRVTLAQNTHKGWQITAAVLNMTNKLYAVDRFSTSVNFGDDVGSFSLKRTFEIGVRYEF